VKESMERSEAIVLRFGGISKQIVIERDPIFDGDITLRIVDDRRGRTLSVLVQRKHVRQLIEALAEAAKLKCTVEE